MQPIHKPLAQARVIQVLVMLCASLISAQAAAAGSGGYGFVPTLPQTQQRQAAIHAAPQLVYNGGHILGSVKVFTVFWGTGVPALEQNQVNQFYTDITQSTYFDWLTEYNTPRQTIGRGSFIGSVVAAHAPAGDTIDDATIQSELASLIRRGYVPQGDGNILIMVHFSPGISVVNGSQTSCSDFCGYHAAFDYQGVTNYYGVIPDQGGPCTNVCGAGLRQNVHRTTVTASHELVESVTDAAVSLPDGTAQLGWYDNNYGEIGDICNARLAALDGWYVQLLWSNKYNACIAHAPAFSSRTSF